MLIHQLQPIELIKKNYEIGLVHGIVTSELIIKDNLYPNDENDKIGCVVWLQDVQL